MMTTCSTQELLRGRDSLLWASWLRCSSWRPGRGRRCTPALDSCQVCAALSGWWHTCHSELSTRGTRCWRLQIKPVIAVSLPLRFSQCHLVGTASQLGDIVSARPGPQTSCTREFHCGTCYNTNRTTVILFFVQLMVVLQVKKNKTDLCTNWTILWVFMKNTSLSAFLCRVAAW